MKKIILFSICIVSTTLYSQKFVKTLESINNTREFALKNKIKSISIYKFNRKSSKDSSLIYSSFYNNYGNLTKEVDYHYKSLKDYSTSYYFYNEKNQRIEQFETVSFLDDDHYSEHYLYTYDSFGYIFEMKEIVYQEDSSYTRNLTDFFPISDTLKYNEYDSKGRIIKFKFFGDYNSYEYYKDNTLKEIKKYTKDKVYIIRTYKNDKIFEYKYFRTPSLKLQTHCKYFYQNNLKSKNNSIIGKEKKSIFINFLINFIQIKYFFTRLRKSF